MSPIIRVEGISKKYLIGHQRRQSYRTLRDEISSMARSIPRRIVRGVAGQGSVGPEPRFETFWALRDVSFDVHEGERLGIIGRNGAGKSTILKILSRITEPTSGRAAIGGRVASLLEVGTGFHPELTGRENIYLNGAVLGMSKTEISRKFDEIVDFAEVEKFLDTPVKQYSSGMYVRLAFAVAAHLEPEILIVDEVLAVGDAKFQAKCLAKMGQFGKQGRTVLFVSHNMHAVRQICDRAILLSQGAVSAAGAVDETIDKYLDDGLQKNVDQEKLASLISSLPPDPDARLIRVSVHQDGAFTTLVENGKAVEIRFEYEIFHEIYGFHAYFHLSDTEGNLLFESNDFGELDQIPSILPGRYLATATIPANLLASRKYELGVGLAIYQGRHCIPNLIRIPIAVRHTGRVNRVLPGYVAPGKLMPAIVWTSERH